MVLVDTPVLVLVPSTTWKLENERQQSRVISKCETTTHDKFKLSYSFCSATHTSVLSPSHHTQRGMSCLHMRACGDCRVSDNQLKAHISMYRTEKIQYKVQCAETFPTPRGTPVPLVITWLKLHAVGGENKQKTGHKMRKGFIALPIGGGDGNTAGVPSKKKASSCENCRREAGLCSELVVEGYCKHTLLQICFLVQVRRHWTQSALAAVELNWCQFCCFLFR